MYSASFYLYSARSHKYSVSYYLYSVRSYLYLISSYLYSVRSYIYSVSSYFIQSSYLYSISHTMREDIVSQILSCNRFRNNQIELRKESNTK